MKRRLYSVTGYTPLCVKNNDGNVFVTTMEELPVAYVRNRQDETYEGTIDRMKVWNGSDWILIENVVKYVQSVMNRHILSNNL